MQILSDIEYNELMKMMDTLRTENGQLEARVIQLSNALLVEKADNARMREALEAWQKFEKYSDKENAYELLKTAEILTKQALKGGE